MAISKYNVRINVDLDKDVIEFLDQQKDKLKLTRSVLIRNLIVLSLHDLGVMKKTGLVFVGQFLKIIIEKFSNVKIKGHPINKSENTETLMVTIDKETKRLLDAYAEDFDIPIKKLTRNLIYCTLDDYKFLEKTRLLKIAFRFKKVLESDKEFEEKIKHGE
jgi:hypothetical protein